MDAATIQSIYEAAIALAPTEEAAIAKSLKLLYTNSPNSCLDYIASGAFKEAYSLSPSLVLKFASTANRTEDEIYSYEETQESPFAKLFIPTYFFSLREWLDVTHLSDEDSYSNARYYWSTTHDTWIPNPDFAAYQLNYAILQPKASLCDSPGYDPNYGYSYPTAWVEEIIKVYGQDYMDRFHKYIQDNHFYDFHSGNVGMLNNKPIILDWLS